MDDDDFDPDLIDYGEVNWVSWVGAIAGCLAIAVLLTYLGFLIYGMIHP